MIDKGQWWEFGQDTGVTPLLFTRSAIGFLMTTESQDLGLTSHPKDSAFLNGDNQKPHAAMHAGYLVSVQWVHFDLTLV